MVCEQDCLSIHTHMHAYIYTHPICSVWWTVYAFFFPRQLSVVHQSVTTQSTSVLLLCNSHRVCVLVWACLPDRPLLIWPVVSAWWGTLALLCSVLLCICMDMERRLNLSLCPSPRQAHMTRQPLHRCSTVSTAKPGQRTHYSGPNKDVVAWWRGKKNPSRRWHLLPRTVSLQPCLIPEPRAAVPAIPL